MRMMREVLRRRFARLMKEDLAAAGPETGGMPGQSGERRGRVPR